MRAIVAGGGIGGLMAALALSRRGAVVEVFEQAPAITEVGAGLQISPNGYHVFEALGLGASLAEIGTRAEAVELRDFRGRLVLRLDLGRLGPAMPYHFVHRADLIGLLAQEATRAGATVTTAARVARSEDTGAEVRVHLGDGTVRSGDVLVGADGLKSVVRAELNGPEAPFFTGQVAWRATVPAPKAMRPVATVWMGPGRH
ncbi:MAG: monooxygenase, partial [Alphaproteobacteria bacterium]